MKFSVALFLLSSCSAVSACPFMQLREDAKKRRTKHEANHPPLRKAIPADAKRPNGPGIHGAMEADSRQLQSCAADKPAQQCGAGRRAASECCEGYECSGRRCVPAAASGWEWPTEYRTFDGTNNNIANPDWGAVGNTLLRLVPAQYADNENEPAGQNRPNPRDISNAIASETTTSENSVGATDLFWQWGQFIDHDLSFSESSSTEFFRIDIPQGDAQLDPSSTGSVKIDFARSLFAHDATNVRQQLNSVSAYIDASLIYGENEERATALKGVIVEKGRLASQQLEVGSTGVTERFLPYNDGGFPNKGGSNATDLFLAGDFRANEHVGLVTLHTLFIREHNFWANSISNMDGNVFLTGTDIYERARIMVTAELQHITYREFLPVLLGEDWDAAYPYAGYDDTVDAGISNVFAAAAFRVGHTMVSDQFLCVDSLGDKIDECSVNISDAFFGTDDIIYYGIEPYLMGMSKQKCRAIDTEVVDSLRNFLFSDPGSPVPGGFDLVALNIQRGRDHGLGDYNTVREKFGLDRVTNFDHFPVAISSTLSNLYGDINDVDAWVGMLAEEHDGNAMVGETLKAVITDQFIRLRDGDRFWYQSYLAGTGLIEEVEKLTLNDIVVRNTAITGGISFTL